MKYTPLPIQLMGAYRQEQQHSATMERTALVSTGAVHVHITAEIVKRHAGRIWVDSSPRVGSTLWVALPVDTQVEQEVTPIHTNR